MSDIVLKVENLWKQYRLGVMGVGSLRDDVGRFWAKLRGKEDPTLKIGQTNDRENLKGEYVWALQDINFEVKRGEILGIIGKNGAGKSTLLKILSKVTSPTKGSIKVKGRIASLLEVGTGFHPELTGRENIFLNGAILGMTKNDIRNKFDEIVEFAGVGKYVDTPVKRYSSGMYVRLAFAVAAHLEPEILIVDEVLAVGDAEFQKKAIGKMQDVSRGEGRTVLFVSHNMGSLSDLCTKGLLMKNGQIHMQEKIDIIIKNYIENSFAKRISESTSIQDSKTRRGDGQVRFTNITIKNIAGIETSNFHQGDDMVIELSCKILEDVDELFSSMAFRSGKTREIITGIPKHQISIKNHVVGNEVSFSFSIKNIPFRVGIYELYFWLGSQNMEKPYDVVDGLIQPITVSPKDNQHALSVGYFDFDEKNVEFSLLK